MQGEILELKSDVSGFKVEQAQLQADVSDIKYLWEDVQRIGDTVGANEAINQKKIM